jgi:A/G-specific adenine glycosylase
MKSHQVWSGRRAGRFQKLLLEWYVKHRRRLPWRVRPTPFKVWVSETMLQQTQVRTVLPYYRRFLRRFPDVKALSEADQEEVLQHWAGLGYYSRARNMQRAASIIVRDHAGHFPRHLDDLLKLPGIGRYTAGAIYSIAFNRPQPIVDGNVRRVVRRLHGILDGAPESFFWKQAAAWLPADRPADFNQAIMELGALVCVPARPACLRCPVESLCGARRSGIENHPRVPRRTRATEEVRLAVLVLIKGSQILITTEREVKYIPGEWGLPVERLRPQDSPEEAANELASRLGGVLLQPERCGTARHAITHRRIAVHVFRARLDSDRPPDDLGGRRSRWIPAEELQSLLTSSLYKKALHFAFAAPPEEAR